MTDIGETPLRGTQRGLNQVRSLVHKLNRAWLNRRFDELKRYLDENIIVAPFGDELVKGREKVVKSYEDFALHSKIVRYGEQDFEVDSLGNRAIAKYRFEILYEMSGKTYHDFGWDIFVLEQKRELGRCLENVNSCTDLEFRHVHCL